MADPNNSPVPSNPGSMMTGGPNKSGAGAAAKPRTRPNYFLVLIFLVVFTAVEVAASYLNSGIKVPILLILATAKASLVILYFMHLKFDKRVYAYWFILGLALILPLLIVLGFYNPGH